MSTSKPRRKRDIPTRLPGRLTRPVTEEDWAALGGVDATPLVSNPLTIASHVFSRNPHIFNIRFKRWHTKKDWDKQSRKVRGLTKKGECIIMMPGEGTAKWTWHPVMTLEDKELSMSLRTFNRG